MENPELNKVYKHLRDHWEYNTSSHTFMLTPIYLSPWGKLEFFSRIPSDTLAFTPCSVAEVIHSKADALEKAYAHYQEEICEWTQIVERHRRTLEGVNPNKVDPKMLDSFVKVLQKAEAGLINSKGEFKRFRKINGVRLRKTTKKRIVNLFVEVTARCSTLDNSRLLISENLRKQLAFEIGSNEMLQIMRSRRIFGVPFKELKISHVLAICEKISK